MIVKITVPNNNHAERSYILSVLFTDFLGLEYHLEFNDSVETYIIEFKGHTLIIKDDFFGKHQENLSYLSLENIPKTLSWFETELVGTHSLALIYGENKLEVNDDCVFCGLDIFASSFFMLSRWEEMVILQKDIHGRCDEREMFVVKHGLYKRAIVNEYVDLLKKLLKLLNENIQFQTYKFDVSITHDIDFLFRFDFKNLLKTMAGDLILRKKIKYPILTLQKYIKFKRGGIKDPFDTFDEFMDLSEKIGTKSAFYFKPSIENEYDATYSIFDQRVKAIMQNIENRGHEIGIHPSKNTFHNAQQMSVEVQRIRSFGFEIKGGRQHFLLYDVADSFGFWEDNNLTYDTGLGFYDRAGFRCGVCYPYFMFDINKRQKRNLLQRPLIVMEGGLIDNFKVEKQHFNFQILELVHEVIKYNGLFVLLWHNNLNTYEMMKYRETYYELMNYLGDRLMETKINN